MIIQSSQRQCFVHVELKKSLYNVFNWCDFPQIDNSLCQPEKQDKLSACMSWSDIAQKQPQEKWWWCTQKSFLKLHAMIFQTRQDVHNVCLLTCVSCSGVKCTHLWHPCKSFQMTKSWTSLWHSILLGKIVSRECDVSPCVLLCHFCHCKHNNDISLVHPLLHDDAPNNCFPAFFLERRMFEIFWFLSHAWAGDAKLRLSVVSLLCGWLLCILETTHAVVDGFQVPHRIPWRMEALHVCVVGHMWPANAINSTLCHGHKQHLKCHDFSIQQCMPKATSWNCQVLSVDSALGTGFQIIHKWVQRWHNKSLQHCRMPPDQEDNAQCSILTRGCNWCYFGSNPDFVCEWLQCSISKSFHMQQLRTK